ncbi:MAG: hypothetical protein V2B18_25555 [Pseudomonadota bacterium]
MAKIINFKGMLPALSPRNLPTEYAQTATNCDLQGGKINPLKGLTSALTIGSGTAYLALHKFYDKYLYWTTAVDTVEGPKIGGDRVLMWTGDGGAPKQMKYADKTGNGTPSSAESRSLGLQSPQGRPSVSTYYTWNDDPLWATDNFYSLDEFVKVVCSDITLRCKLAHTSVLSTAIANPWDLWNYIATYWDITDNDPGAAAWAQSTAYTVGNEIYIGGTLYLPFKCTRAHKAAAATKPGSGATWGNYWKLGVEGDYVDEVVYAHTYVSDWGQESAPSLPSQPEPAYTRTVKVIGGFEHTDTDGTIAVGAGNLKLITGTGTAFEDLCRSGDYIMASGQIREIDTVTNDTSMTVTQNFDAAISAGTSYEYYPGDVAYIRVYRVSTGKFGAEYQYLPYWYSPDYWVTGRRYYANEYVGIAHGTPGTDVFARKYIYKAASEHVSGVWATDLAAGKWVLQEEDLFVTNDNGIPVKDYYKGIVDANFGAKFDEIIKPYRINQNLGAILETEGWDEPPSGLGGLIQELGGSYAGFTGNYIYRSEPAVPYAFPLDYRVTVPYTIVALALWGNSIIALTTAFPEVITGYAGNHSQRTFKVPQSCVAKQGVVTSKFGVVYPSPDGLVLITETAWNLLTKDIFTKAQWNVYDPEDFVAVYYEDQYIAFDKNGNTALIFDMEQRDGVFVITQALTTGLTVKDAQVMDEEDKIYLLTVEAGSYKAQTWNTGTSQTWTWKSKKFTFPGELAWNCARIIGAQSAAAPITFKVYLDGTLYQTLKVYDTDLFKFTGDDSFQTLEVEMSGTAEVEALYMAPSPDELWETGS